MSEFSSPRNLVVVGRTDGSIDLYRLDTAVPLHCLDINDLVSMSSNHSNGVAFLSWLPGSPSVFVVVTSKGDVSLFDLLKDPYRPVLEQAGFKMTKLCRGLIQVDMSCKSLGGGAVMLAIGNGQEQLIRKIRLVESRSSDLTALLESMDHWMARMSSTTLRMAFSPTTSTASQDRIYK